MKIISCLIVRAKLTAPEREAEKMLEEFTMDELRAMVPIELKQCYRKDRSKYISLADGPWVYPFAKASFERISKEAGARRKYGSHIIVDTVILDEYLDTFRLTQKKQTKLGSQDNAEKSIRHHEKRP